MLTSPDFGDGFRPRPAIIPIRNSEGSWSRFSVDRLARDLAMSGQPIGEATATARQLLAEALASGVTELETDDVRHWLAERDPLVFAKRRTPVGRFDAELTRLATLARGLADEEGLALHQMYLAHFMPGGDPEDDPAEPEPDPDADSGDGDGGDGAPAGGGEKKKPRWIEGETIDPDDLDGSFGREADGAKFLDPEKFDEWPPEEGRPDTGEPDLEEPDFTKPGARGDHTYRADDRFKGRSAYTIHTGDGTFTAFGPGGECPVDCGENWFLELDYFQRRADCLRVDFSGPVRSGLLLAIHEAYRRCQSTKCELVRFRILFQGWTCLPNANPKPLVSVTTQLAVQCWAL